MSFQIPVPRSSIAFLLVMLLLWCVPVIIQAQEDDQPAPQFLFRRDNRLVLLDGYTGEATELPIEIATQDRFTWMPDGMYLLAQLYEAETYTYCLNLYDVENQTWIYDEPIDCSIDLVSVSADGKQIAYAINEDFNGKLWLFTLEDETSRKIYQTIEGQQLMPFWITKVEWSPTQAYLTFVSSHWWSGSTLNTLLIMNSANRDLAAVSAPEPYYATYDPVWSDDDSWFLITLQEEYVTTSTLPYTNHRGDLYLVYPDTGEMHRLTYTPGVSEVDVHWTEEGQIEFTEIIEQQVSLTIEEARNIEEVPFDEIDWPEPFSIEDVPARLGIEVMTSPDPAVGAWITSYSGEDGEPLYELRIGTARAPRSANFSFPIPTSYKYRNIVIGWRPSDYPYRQE